MNPTNININQFKIIKKQKWNSITYKERSLRSVFEYISEICSKNNIPKIIVDTAKILYKRLIDCKRITFRGENRTSLIAACVFKACKVNNNYRGAEEIAKFFDLDNDQIIWGKKQFKKIMKDNDE